MSVCHAAASHTRTVASAGRFHSQIIRYTNNRRPFSATPSTKVSDSDDASSSSSKPPDDSPKPRPERPEAVISDEFATAFFRAGIHGHSPHWKRRGWKAEKTRFGNYEDSPYYYLVKEVVDVDLERPLGKGGVPLGTDKVPRFPKARARSDKPVDSSREPGSSPLRSEMPHRSSSTRPASSSRPLSKSRGYATVSDSALPTTNGVEAGLLEDNLVKDDEDLEDGSIGAESDDGLEGTGSSATAPFLDKGLKPGDWVCTVNGAGAQQHHIYLGPHIRSKGDRKALLHGLGNVLSLCRYDDILFKIPGVIDEETANRATTQLQLSPPEYTQYNESEMNRDFSNSGMQSVLELSAEEEMELWGAFGVPFGGKRGNTTWESGYLAKMACGKALRRISQIQETLKKEILAKGIRDVYMHIKSSRKNRGAFSPAKYDRNGETVTVEEVYDLVYSGKMASAYQESAAEVRASGLDLKQLRMFAVYDFLMGDVDHYVADTIDLLTTARFRIRSLPELHVLTSVRGWIRNNDSRVTAFKKKAETVSRLLNEHKDKVQSHPSTENFEPQDVAGLQKWSGSDVDIIEFLRYFLVMKRRMQVNPYEATTALLIKSIDPKSSLFKTSPEIPSFLDLRMSVINFLKRIGVFQEWENLVVHEWDLHLRAWTRQLQKKNFVGHELGTEMSTQPASEKASDPQALRKSLPVALDECDSLRHDFGQLPVYVIDEATASELDDGISIEKSDKLDSHGQTTHWVHIHVADPTATLRPQDELSKLTQARNSTIYFPEMTWPMLPFEVIQEYGWSLGSLSTRASEIGDSNAAREDGQRVLTFSARLDYQGAVLEEKVQPSIIRNVKVVTYDVVNEHLDPATKTTSSQSKISIVWPYNQKKEQFEPVKREIPNLMSTHIDDLKRLKDMSSLLIRQRVQGTLCVPYGTSSHFTLHPRPLVPCFETSPKPLAYNSSPSLSLTFSTSELAGSAQGPSQLMVSELMVLAGKIAAQHSKEHNLPVPYRGQPAPAAANPEAIQEILQLRNPETGAISLEEVRSRKVNFAPAMFSLEPVGHWTMSIKGADEGGSGYLRATSPLRRYSDLLVHWQIKHSLLSAANKANKNGPPFDERDVQAIIGEIDRSTRFLTRMERRSRSFWHNFLLYQKLEEMKRDPTKDPWFADLVQNKLTCVVGKTTTDPRTLQILAEAKIPELGGWNANVIVDRKSRHGSRIKQDNILNVEIAGIILDEYSKVFLRIKD